jgi:hypothetical protein
MKLLRWMPALERSRQAMSPMHSDETQHGETDAPHAEWNVHGQLK